jgi:transcriptional regulator with XRE-family HTH domain
MIDRRTFGRLVSRQPGATLSSVANRAGIAPNRLGQLLTGVATPRRRELESLATVLRVSPATIDASK